MPTNDPRPSKADRRDEARLKAIALKKEQERKARRNRLLAIGGLAIAVIALAVVVTFIVRQGNERAAAYSDVAYGGGQAGVVSPGLDAVTTPQAADDEGGIPVSSGGVGVAGDDDTVLSIYFDFMCPFCGQFDQINSADLEELAAEDGVTVVYQPLSFLDRTSQGTNYSTRAANALAVVADQSPEHVQAFITAMYAEGTQPEEGTEGLTDEEIAAVATGVGVPQEVADAFTDTASGTFEIEDENGDTTKHEGTWRSFAPWVYAAYTAAGEKIPELTTPTILIDGVKWEGNWQTPGTLRAAVEEAAAAAQG